MRITRRRFYKILDTTSSQTKRNYRTTFEQLPSHFLTSKRYPVSKNQNQNQKQNKNKSLKFI
jgi:hypothetical protein